MKLLISTHILTLLWLLSFRVFAQIALPPVNLGSTSFIDGKGGPGTLVEESIISYSSNTMTDNQGKDISQDSNIENFSAATLIAHITKTKIWGGYYGFEMLIPSAKLSVEVFNKNQESGMGDISISPLILQWVDKQLFNLPFNHRLNLSFIVPSGRYDKHKSLNIGGNALSFNPHYAFTLNLTKKSELSVRAHYLWNGKNNAPYSPLSLRHTQAGQAFHINIAGSYQLRNRLRVGLSSYYLKQLNQHEANGVPLPNSLEEVFAIGPGLRYQSTLLTLHANAYFESSAKNRSKGERFVFKASKVF